MSGAREVNRSAAPKRRRRRQPAAATAPRCERLPACLLDVMRGGAVPAVELRGKSWGIVAGGKVQARRKERERAQALVAAAQRELAQQGHGAPLEERRRNVLITPQRPNGEIVRYEVIPSADLLTSHRATDFRPHPHYPQGVQERAYHLDRGEQQKVIRGAQRLQVALVISRDPTPASGPPIVTERGPHGHPAMGGNGRGMMISRAYDGEGAEGYRTELIRQAAEFGLDANAVKAIRQPVLVRVLEGLPADAPRELLVAAVRRTNESLTQGLDAATLGVAHARALSESTVRQIGEALGDGEYSLRELMAARADLFREALQRDQVLTPQNSSEWLTAAGALTETAKDRLEAMFLGLVLGTKDRIQASAPALLRKLERAVPHLLAVRGAQLQAFDLVPLVQEAVDLLNDARARSLTLEDSLQQSVLFTSAVKVRSPQVVELARLLDGAGQRAVAEAFARWSKAAIHDPNQLLLLGSPPTPEEAFSALLGERRRNPGPPKVDCPRCSGSGLVVPWAGHINVCPSCKGTRVLAAPAPDDTRQQRLVNPETIYRSHDSKRLQAVGEALRARGFNVVGPVIPENDAIGGPPYIITNASNREISGARNANPRRARPLFREGALVQLAPGILQQGAMFRDQPKHGPVRPLSAFVKGEVLQVKAVGGGRRPRYLVVSTQDVDPRQARDGWIDQDLITRAGPGSPAESDDTGGPPAEQMRLFNPRKKKQAKRARAPRMAEARLVLTESGQQKRRAAELDDDDVWLQRDLQAVGEIARTGPGRIVEALRVLVLGWDDGVARKEAWLRELASQHEAAAATGLYPAREAAWDAYNRAEGLTTEARAHRDFWRSLTPADLEWRTPDEMKPRSRSAASAGGKKKVKVKTIRTKATNTRQVALALRRSFGAVLPRRVNVSTPIGKLKLRRQGNTWRLWQDGKEAPDLGDALTADFRKLRWPRKAGA